jgi:hypothetical protein
MFVVCLVYYSFLSLLTYFDSYLARFDPPYFALLDIRSGLSLPRLYLA